MPQTIEFGPIDAVITWVNGADPAHATARAWHLARATGLCENATNPHRWGVDDEILYCLQSIENFAPWVRHVFIVVDGAGPDLWSLSRWVRQRVSIVSHQEIFRGYEAVLPTFNSLAIESMLWRIPGLAERFLYFNDDVFLAAPLHPDDVFEGMTPVLRGAWRNYGALADRAADAADPAKFNHFMQINAARLAGFAADHLFSAAHVVHPLRKSVMKVLFAQHQSAFEANIAYRFRDIRQFLPQGLHNHACIAQGAARIMERADHIHIKSGQGIGRARGETQAILQRATHADIKFLCVNDLPQLEAVIPEARDWIGRVIGGFGAVQAE